MSVTLPLSDKQEDPSKESIVCFYTNFYTNFYSNFYIWHLSF